MKLAYLIMGECRFPDISIQKIQKYIVDFYDADLFICCQKIYDYKEELVQKAFTKNVKYCHLYEKPDAYSFLENEELKLYTTDNCFQEPYLQYYINLFKMYECILNHLDNYDYFMCMRPDMDILFPFPGIEILESIPKGVYTIDANYAKSWGGLSIGIFVHRNYIVDYLRSYYDVIQNRTFKKFLEYPSTNQEHFFLYCLEQKKITFQYISQLNYFFTANSLEDRTTWSHIQFDATRNKFYKYGGQYEEAYENLDLWEKGYRWGILDGKKISLLPPLSPPLPIIPSRIKFYVHKDPHTGKKRIIKNPNFIHPREKHKR